MFDAFRSGEVKGVLRCLKVIEDELTTIQLSGNVVRQAEQRTRDSASEITQAVKSGEQSAEVVAWIMLSNVSLHELTYTNPFIYRGVLSMRGQDLLKVWNTANRKLVELGFQTQDVAHSEAKKLREQISNQG